MKFTEEVCELFDATILSDVEFPEGGDGSEPLNEWKPIYAIGWNAELGAGLRGGTITNFYPTEQALEDFCERHIERFRALSALDAPAPDASDWDMKSPNLFDHFVRNVHRFPRLFAIYVTVVLIALGWFVKMHGLHRPTLTGVLSLLGFFLVAVALDGAIYYTLTRTGLMQHAVRGFDRLEGRK